MKGFQVLALVAIAAAVRSDVEEAELEEHDSLENVLPEPAEVEKWVAFYRSPEGGNQGASYARDSAMEMLSGKPPELEDVKKWSAFYRSPEGGNQGASYALGSALEMLSGKHAELPEDDSPAAQPTEVNTATKQEGSSPESQLLGCSLPAVPVHGDPFGHACKERVSKIAHDKQCTTQCKMHYKPEPASLKCSNGNIGSFKCRKVIDVLALACWAKCKKEDKGFRYELRNGQIKCDCAGKAGELPDYLRFDPDDNEEDSEKNTKAESVQRQDDAPEVANSADDKGSKKNSESDVQASRSKAYEGWAISRFVTILSMASAAFCW